jgi:hypothetical protein
MNELPFIPSLYILVLVAGRRKCETFCMGSAGGMLEAAV